MFEDIENTVESVFAEFGDQDFDQENQEVNNSSAFGARDGFTAVQKACQMGALELHNSLRARHGVPALTLDDSISNSAQAYAEYLANSGRFEHSSDRDGLGENLYESWGSAPEDNSDQGRTATQSWYDEINDYDYNEPGFSMQTGHFTQVVWKSTSKLGMGIAFGDGDGKVIVVGRYSPAGNMEGDFPENVPQPL
ncbi:unnamed protein product [Adineta steineri]|uniref:SCP domain-containing protein n=1 Tax=Adineta steineri TaxID=433720 RepID=A0A819ETV0_9BILA|nr:unnamed protein product [Adineta steineri]CAF3855735.1 unnamed protein product [Adineta steineri]